MLERQVRAGGNAISERFDGFLMEHGPTTFNASTTGALAQLDALGLSGSALDLGAGVRKRYLRDNGRLHGVSIRPTGFLRANYLSVAGRLRVLAEAFIRRGDGAGETVHAFATRRFGTEFADKVMEPLAAGMFMGDARQLSLNAVFPKLAMMEAKNGSISRSILKAGKGTEPGRRLLSWQGGTGTVPQVLAAQLGARVQTGVAVTKLVKTPGGFEVHSRATMARARAVVLAVQPHVAAGLLAGLVPDTAAALEQIASPPVNVVFLGYRREQVAHPLDGLGYLGTKDASRVISGVQFGSTMYPGRAPDGHVAISAYAGGMRNPELGNVPDADLVAQVRAELAEMLGIRGEPVVVRTRRWALGLPQYTLGHATRARTIAQTPQQVPGLFLTGNYLDGVSVANCLAAADRTAGLVAGMLGAGGGKIGLIEAGS